MTLPRENEPISRDIHEIRDALEAFKAAVYTILDNRLSKQFQSAIVATTRFKLLARCCWFS